MPESYRLDVSEKIRQPDLVSTRWRVRVDHTSKASDTETFTSCTLGDLIYVQVGIRD